MCNVDIELGVIGIKVQLYTMPLNDSAKQGYVQGNRIGQITETIGINAMKVHI